MQSFDPIYLQRLIDGELDAESTRKLLELAESNPHLWRDMASAFVENQMWQTDFQSLEREAAALMLKSHDDGQGSAENWTLPNWLSLAAGILLAMTAGLLIGRNMNLTSEMNGSTLANSFPESPHSELTDDRRESSPAPSHNLVEYQPDYHMALQDANGKPILESEIPLYRVDNAQQAGIQFDQHPSIPREFVERAGRSGYGLSQDVNYISGQLDDGRRFWVPVRTIHLSRGQ